MPQISITQEKDGQVEQGHDGDGDGHTVPAAIHAGAEQYGGTVARMKKDNCKLPLQDRR